MKPGRFRTNLFIITLSQIFLSPLLKEDSFKDQLSIDPITIADSSLPVQIPINERKKAAFENLLHHKPIDSIPIETYFDIIFRYRDTALIPLFIKIIRSNSVHPYFKASAIYALGEITSPADFSNLYTIFKSDTNDLVREYLASAMGKIANSTHRKILSTCIKEEENGYVRKTLQAAFDRASGERRAKITYLPLFDTTHFIQLRTYPSETPFSAFSLHTQKRIDVNNAYIPVANRCSAPHMQYKLCQSIYSKVQQPFSSFALPGVSHVGEDSGWLFAGMPIHAIMNGRVVLIHHEESWGCLICIESVLANSEPVCTYYGHLSSNIDVYIGMNIKMGDKIGEIGPGFTFQNGGYRSHLHLGIEKAPFKTALITGYHDDIEHWYSPVDFIKQHRH